MIKMLVIKHSLLTDWWCNKVSFNKVVMCYFKAKFHENIVTLQNCAYPLDQGLVPSVTRHYKHENYIIVFTNNFKNIHKRFCYSNSFKMSIIED